MTEEVEKFTDFQDMQNRARVLRREGLVVLVMSEQQEGPDPVFGYSCFKLRGGDDFLLEYVGERVLSYPIMQATLDFVYERDYGQGVETSIGTFDYEDEEWVYELPLGGQLVLTRQGVPGKPLWCLELRNEPLAMRDILGMRDGDRTRVFRQFGNNPEEVVGDFLEWFRVWAAAGAWATSVVPHLTIQRAGNPGDPWWERL